MFWMMRDRFFLKVKMNYLLNIEILMFIFHCLRFSIFIQITMTWSYILLSAVNYFVFHFIPLHRILMTRDFYSVIVESYWIWIISRQWKLIILKWPTPSVFQSKRKDVNRYANSIFNIIFWNLRRNENECSYLRKIPKKIRWSSVHSDWQPSF